MQKVQNLLVASLEITGLLLLILFSTGLHH